MLELGSLAALLLLAAPAVAWANCAGLDLMDPSGPWRASPSVIAGELLEIRESAPLHAAPGGPTMPGAFPHGLTDAVATRLAQATAVSNGLVPCGDAFAGWSSLEFHAQTRIPFGSDGAPSGPGELTGVFSVDLANGGGVPGKVSGSLTFQAGAPMALVDGTWSTLGKNKRTGDLFAVAYVPIPLACTAETEWFLSDLDSLLPHVRLQGCFYLDPLFILGPSDGSGLPFALVPLKPYEYSQQFGTGIAKFEFWFFSSQ